MSSADIYTNNEKTINRKTLTASVAVETKRPWTVLEKVSFRIAFVYFLILCIPLTEEFYKVLFGTNWLHPHYLNLQSISSFYPPKIIDIATPDGVFGFLSYINLVLIFVFAVVVGLVWTWLDKKTQRYDKMYYWLRVLARYRFGYAMVAWGLKKVFVHQMLLPTEGVLNTAFGDMAEKKLYWLHVGISPVYQVFLGFAEFIPGLLLLHRKTATLGAALAGVVCFNICIANQVYDGGVAIPALYYALIGGFIAWYDLPSIYSLLVKKENSIRVHYYPVFNEQWQRSLKTGLKIAGGSIFVLLTTFLWGYGWYGDRDNYNIPTNPGLSDSRGYYDVTEFRLNNKQIPYSPLDSIRWHDVTFEKWSTLSYTTNKEGKVDRMKVYHPHKRKRDMGMTRFELGGVAGSRQYFYYEIDSVNHVLNLENKNPLYEFQTLRLAYSRPTSERIILNGVNENKDSIYVVLDKINKEYLLNTKTE